MRVRIAIISAVLSSFFLPASAVAPLPALSRTANLLTLDMTSPSAGWAVGTTGLLRTTDGGVHWQSVTPPTLGSRVQRSSYGLVTAFLDQTHAWVAVDNSVTVTASGQSNPPTTLRLFRTADAGRHWYPLPLLRLGTFYYAGKLQFVSRDVGWLDIIRNVGAGSVWFDLYRTLDGGIHWQRVLQVGSPHTSSEAPLGCDLCDSSLTFSGRTTVWFTGCWCGVGTGSSFLFVSRNAGRTWRAVPLAQRPHRGKSTVGTLPPVLFDLRNGVLPAIVLGSNPGRTGGSPNFFDAYVTHDGGRHWTRTTPVPITREEGYPAFPYSFPDRLHGFFLMGKRLYRTSDSEQHWHALPVRIPLALGDTTQFLDGRRGFALRPGEVQGRHSTLWRTLDGGETWNVVITSREK